MTELKYRILIDTIFNSLMLLTFCAHKSIPPQLWWVFQDIMYYPLVIPSEFCFFLFKWQMRGTWSFSWHYQGVSLAVCSKLSFFLNKKTRTYNLETTQSSLKSIKAINIYIF